MDFRIQAIRRKPADGAGDQGQPASGINRGFVLGQYDQCRAGLVQTRVHAGGELYAAAERQADMHLVAHGICGQRALQLADDAVMAGKVDAALSGLPVEPRFARDAGYSVPYFEAGLVLVVRADDDAVRRVEDLAGKNGPLIS